MRIDKNAITRVVFGLQQSSTKRNLRHKTTLAMKNISEFNIDYTDCDCYAKPFKI